MPAFATLTGFARGGASLNAAQLERVKRAAEFIAQSWRGTSPITWIRITGYIDANEWQSDLGQRRAAAVRDALLRALGSAWPGLATRLRWIMEDRGFSPVAKVEVYLWHGPTSPPVYVSTYGRLGQVPMLHGSFAGSLGASPLTPALQDFLNQVKLRPTDFRKLLLTVALHPDPARSRIWDRQSFTFGKQTRSLSDDILMSGGAKVYKVVADELGRIADGDPSIKEQIADERHLRYEMANAFDDLGKKVPLQPFIMAPLLLQAPDPSILCQKLCKLALDFAQKMLPQDLVRRIMNSEASEAHLTYLGELLRDYAKKLQRRDKHFAKIVQIARKWQREGKWPSPLAPVYVPPSKRHP